MNYILKNLKKLKEAINFACNSVNRSADEIQILPITKGVDIEKIKFLYDNGFKEFGENRVKEAYEKIIYLPKNIKWHLVGHLQSNKVKKALEIFKVIQSIDRFEIIDEIDKRGIDVEVFLEFNCSQEEQKHGFKVEEWEKAVENILNSKHLKLIGFMTLGPYPVDEIRSRKAFEKLRIIRDKAIEKFNLKNLKLSMGMSEDFIYAIMEGADIIRIGRAIFEENFNFK
ncbi:MAG: YggS family pyridoxal phosphate-dependent enzyme [candidate division WOR-3 bacterium]